ncbi:hypothetical protein CQA70_29340, partial [Klebsiella pneumoniae]
WLEAGQREPIIFRANQALLAQLTTTQQTIFWRQVDGGHDALCWRGGLTAGLIQLAGSGPTRTDHFSREPGATGATHHNTADDFLAS